ncbi:2-C-methyl-D-erythritol 4-phosphate cytidylyltransferase [Shewanella sairae]|uniref:2-C-methyl-D-erythritol 4-phosphate cytidylyltransferase n=1 Tax=Shewanella sairae TaxID=190310 RepID=A0ABQ4PFU6_9GAMM|nr:2-C-methyl-D-erythritol 4-phosphate cytidylyltransferase [Shewanella sairae]MCL1130105.1 2-C-methyl-D-erythritol 4-phosphate cytidylyltransferase [Shewanella sairae]GIU45986.1 2-C-methyl-D-erythritol 4-phosphate cytidylyltransferase [Shewanella sairae]
MSQTPQQIIAIVPAAGIGSRMGATLPKQYLALNEQTILGHTLDCLLSHPSIEKVVVALSPVDDYFAELPQAVHPKLEAVIGGKERADSVLAGLQIADAGAWVLVHDAARPCLTHADIDKLIASSSAFPQGAILAAPVRDTMKRTNAEGVITATVCREQLWHALTPQFFPVHSLKKNLTDALAAGALITDEASAMEWAGIMPAVVSGRADNIKVTHPDDLQLASLFLKSHI